MLKRLFHPARSLLGFFFVATVIARVIAPQLTAQAGFSPDAMAWLDVIANTGYLQTLIYATEFLSGLALLTHQFVPLATIILAPVILNISLLHGFLDPRPGRLILVGAIALSYSILLYSIRQTLRTLLNTPLPSHKQPQVFGIDISIILQALLGLLFVIAGGAKLVIPSQLSVGNLLVDGMKATGYLYALLGLTEVICGLCLIINRWIPMILTALAPIMGNIILFHLFLEPRGIAIAILISAIYSYLITIYWTAFSTLLKRNSPT